MQNIIQNQQKWNSNRETSFRKDSFIQWYCLFCTYMYSLGFCQFYEFLNAINLGKTF